MVFRRSATRTGRSVSAAIEVAPELHDVRAGKISSSLDWLRNTLVVIGLTSVTQAPHIQEMLKNEPDAVAIGIGTASALALGPDGEVEAWGKKQITVALGQSYQSGNNLN